MTFTQHYLEETQRVVAGLDAAAIEKTVDVLAKIREGGGRLFILGVGGSAANASHAVNDFRKICGFEAYAPTDNVSELTARTNDEGWETVFAGWLVTSKLNAKDGVASPCLPEFHVTIKSFFARVIPTYNKRRRSFT